MNSWVILTWRWEVTKPETILPYPGVTSNGAKSWLVPLLSCCDFCNQTPPFSPHCALTCWPLPVRSSRKLNSQCHRMVVLLQANQWRQDSGFEAQERRLSLSFSAGAQSSVIISYHHMISYHHDIIICHIILMSYHN